MTDTDLQNLHVLLIMWTSGLSKAKAQKLAYREGPMGLNARAPGATLVASTK